MDKVYRQYFATKTKVNDDGSIKAVISTNSPDRYNEIVNPKGARLDNYRKNPVVLFNHNSNIPPIGKNVSIAVYDGEIVATTQFAKTQLGQEIASLYRDGTMAAFSIGFISNESDYNDQNQKVYNDWELLEYSCVPIPANPEAVAMALKTIQSPELKEFLNEYEMKKTIDDRFKEFDNKFADLTLDYNRAHESATFIEEYFNDFKEEVKTLKESNSKLENQIKGILETINNKTKANEKEILKHLIKDLVIVEMKKITNKVK